MIVTDDERLFYSMAAYEIRCSERYRRFFSVIFMTSDHGGNGSVKLKEFLSESLRESDVCTEFEGHTGIIMCETDKDSALEAVKRLGRLQYGLVDVRSSIASFPEDGTTYRNILQKASNRLHEAKRRERGAIVTDE